MNADKTPEEIIRALWRCGSTCEGCPAFGRIDCRRELMWQGAGTIESQQAQLSASQRRERAAVEILQTIDWIGSSAKGRIEDAIGALLDECGPEAGEEQK